MNTFHKCGMNIMTNLQKNKLNAAYHTIFFSSFRSFISNFFILCAICSLRNERYIDMHDTDNDKRSALHLAACEGHFSAVQYLLHYNAGYPKAKDRYCSFIQIYIQTCFIFYKNTIQCVHLFCVLHKMTLFPFFNCQKKMKITADIK